MVIAGPGGLDDGATAAALNFEWIGTFASSSGKIRYHA
jgi:hypothetical protein